MAKAEVTLSEVTFSLFGAGAKWVADTKQIEAAWEMYVELVTRTALVPFDEQRGLLRETLTSLYRVVSETRVILRKHGVAVARPAKKGAVSFAEIAVDVVNRGLRPFLTTWHPVLLAHEARRPESQSQLAHEQAWSERANACKELAAVQRKLHAYAALLADVCDIRADQLIQRPMASG